MAFTSGSGRTRTSLSEINVTPLVDVVLVLLIIFMVTAPILQTGIEVNLPRTRSVKAVNPEQRAVIVLKIYRDRTFKQIAELLGLSQNTAASRYRYGIQRLRSLLQELFK